MFDPVKQVNEGLVFVLISVLLLLAWKYRDRIIFLFTGDDRLHFGVLDLVWFWCCRCAGCCDGEWTRMITCWCGHINLVKEFGRKVGLVSVPIEIQNIVAGDIPFNKKGDFYLTVECGDNPPMSTSIAENCDPTVIHLATVIEARVRDSPLENQLRFVVKELNIFGSDELCELRLNAQKVHEWLRKDSGKIRRFQMTAMDRSSDFRSPPWLAMEFHYKDEFRGKQEFTV